MNMINRMKPYLKTVLLSLLLLTSLHATTKAQLEENIDRVLTQFNENIQGGEGFIKKVKGYLVFPIVKKAGFFIGGEYGEGALRVNGTTQMYYSLTSASIGLQFGFEEHSVAIAFLTEDALTHFMRSNGWEGGIDGTIAIQDWGAAKDINSISYENPIIGFIFNTQGFMGGISLEGTKFSRITLE
jgi:lipid-binding SYLF domain-containing protein